jgi:Bacterial Ig-like domain (group 3)/FG-GAP-like repeat
VRLSFLGVSAFVMRCAASFCALLLTCLGASVASASTPWLRPMSVFPSGGVAQFTAVADFNRDGKQDIIVSNSNGNISLLLGNGNGTFGAPHTIATLGAGTYPIATADFNRDGIADLVVLNTTKQSVSIYLGYGNGTFEAPKSQTVGNSPTCMVVGDINGDGSPDLIFNASHATSNAPNLGFTVMLGAGTGYLHAPHFFIAANGGAGSVIAVGDVNNDGHLDVVTTDVYSDAEVFLGNGNDTFREQPTFFIGLPPSQIVLADFYGKGHLDLAVGNLGYENENTQLEVMEGMGDGTFAQPTSYLTAGYFPGWVSAADMNGDGRLDLVVGSSYSNTVAVLINNGAGTFTSMPADNATPQLSDGAGQGPLGIGDFNGDKRPDVAVASQAGLQVMLNLGGGLLQAPSATELWGGSGQMFAADMTGDGHLDLAVETYGFGGNVGAVNLLVGDGHGHFSNHYAGILPENDVIYGPIAGGSFNGNGKVGAAAFVLGGLFLPAYNNGTGSFTTGPLFTLASTDTPAFLCAGDFNRDGYSDFAELDNDQVDIYLNHHDGTYSGPVSYAVGSSPVYIMQRDVNGDGKTDLIVVNQNSDSVSILLGKGDGTFATAKQFAAGYKPNVVTTGDFNGDGKIDLAIGDSSKVSILLGKGDGAFTFGNSYTVPGPVRAVAMANLRGGSVQDLLTLGPGNMYLLTGNGNGTFNAPQAYAVAAGTGWIVPSDFNEDGAEDVAISGNNGSPTVVLFLNQRGTHVALSASTKTPAAGQSVKLPATVSASVAGSGTPTGSVTFRDGTKTLATVSLAGGKATFTTSTLAAGKHTITASYTGSTSFNAHTSAAVVITVQ